MLGQVVSDTLAQLLALVFCCPALMSSLHFDTMVLTILGYLTNEKWLYQQVINHHLADDPNCGL